MIVVRITTFVYYQRNTSLFDRDFALYRYESLKVMSLIITII